MSCALEEEKKGMNRAVVLYVDSRDVIVTRATSLAADATHNRLDPFCVFTGGEL